MVPRDPQPGESTTQWNVQLNFPDEAAAFEQARAAAPPPAAAAASLAVDWSTPAAKAANEAYVTGGGNPIAVWREMNAVLDNPVRAIRAALSVTSPAEMSRVPDAAADPRPAAGTGPSDQGQGALSYADAGRNVRTDATPAEAPARAVDIFIGGVLDEESGIVKDYAEFYRRSFNREVQYFPFKPESDIRNFIAGLPKGTRVNLIGHSWGADTAAKIAQDFPGRINTLITVDPVSQHRPDFAMVRQHTNLWIAVNATPTQHMELSNVIAALGGDWGSSPEESATIYAEMKENHAEFEKMMETKLADGRAIEQILLGR